MHLVGRPGREDEVPDVDAIESRCRNALVRDVRAVGADDLVALFWIHGGLARELWVASVKCFEPGYNETSMKMASKGGCF